jgi:hypothetical protein
MEDRPDTLSMKQTASAIARLAERMADGQFHVGSEKLAGVRVQKNITKDFLDPAR